MPPAAFVSPSRSRLSSRDGLLRRRGSLGQVHLAAARRAAPTVSRLAGAARAASGMTARPCRRPASRTPVTERGLPRSPARSPSSPSSSFATDTNCNTQAQPWPPLLTTRSSTRTTSSRRLVSCRPSTLDPCCSRTPPERARAVPCIPTHGAGEAMHSSIWQTLPSDQRLSLTTAPLSACLSPLAPPPALPHPRRVQAPPRRRQARARPVHQPWLRLRPRPGPQPHLPPRPQARTRTGRRASPPLAHPSSFRPSTRS